MTAIRRARWPGSCLRTPAAASVCRKSDPVGGDPQEHTDRLAKACSTGREASKETRAPNPSEPGPRCCILILVNQALPRNPRLQASNQ